MAKHNEFGREGEDLAATWLIKNNYEVLHRNWRHSHYEVDIIACKENILHFVEVKTRRDKAFGYPEESVTKKKIENLMNAAEAFLAQFPQWKRVQFDVLSILALKNEGHEYFLIQDVSL
ncbi:MAG: YraN family protein [Bacteroidetes bacterium]|nr:YraN family protein [Bacteroidota bacterium]MBS1974144.1 YraN family protein [Bacteroidota bacterium]